MAWKYCSNAAGRWTFLFSLSFSTALACQIPQPAAPADPPAAAQRLAPGDEVEISVFQAPELATQARLDATGAISMPEVGTVALAGETAAEAEQVLAARLRASYLLKPQVHVLVRAFAPQSVTVLGAVKNPGVYSARTFPDLAAMVAAAGGVSASAGERVLVTRASGAIVSLGVDALARDATAPHLPLQAGDMVRVLPAATVYVGGDVAKPGAYILPPSGLTVLEALSLAGGVERNGRASQTRIVHTDAAGHASVQWVDVGRILRGQRPDLPLQPFDLLYIPHSTERATLFRGLETALGVSTSILTGVVIFH